MIKPLPEGEAGSPCHLAVLNAGGRDPAQDFRAGAGRRDDPAAPHPPINHHAYAACTRGTFEAHLAAAIATKRPVLLLLRRDLGASLRVVRRLKAAGCVVAVTFKEAGAVQLAARLGRAADLRLLGSVLETVDGFIAPTRESEALLGALSDRSHGARKVPGVFVPTPYPIEDEQWDFSRPVAERRGVFVGTREFTVPARQHLAATVAACHLHRLTGEPVTVINIDGRPGARLLAELGFSSAPGAALRWVEGRLSYPAYLTEMARHRLVFQLDRSGVPGQVAGDALLCRLACVGGDGAVERLAFPGLAGHDKDPAQLVEIAAALLSDPVRYEHSWRDGQARARQTLSFSVIGARLAAFYDSLGADRPS